MKKYDYILFDLDGTLTDPGEGITNSVAYVLEKNGIPVPPRQELYKFIGPPLKESFEEYYGFSPEDAYQGVITYREYFDRQGIFENKVLDGAIEGLDRLRRDGYILVLATSKPEGAALRILERFELKRYFHFACGADLEGLCTKKEDVIRYAMKTAGITDPTRAVMVGDRKHDVEGAKANGMECVGVTFGYGSREELENAGAAFIANSFDELLSFIEKN